MRLIDCCPRWVVVVGAGGGLGQYAVQYARVRSARVIGVDTGEHKREMVESFGARFVDVSIAYFSSRKKMVRD